MLYIIQTVTVNIPKTPNTQTVLKCKIAMIAEYLVKYLKYCKIEVNITELLFTDSVSHPV